MVTKEILGQTVPAWTNSDSHNKVSVMLCDGIAERLDAPPNPVSATGTTLGTLFERAVTQYLDLTIELMRDLTPHHLTTTRPAKTKSSTGASRRSKPIAAFAQFAHLAEIEEQIAGNAALQAALGGDYIVDSDILIGFEPPGATFPDGVEPTAAGLSRSSLLGPIPILHASISCKWTMRRDRAQNTRLEALNLVRNRKGRLPHIMAVTMEADPEILGSLCLGTGDIDCVYHAALGELVAAASAAVAVEDDVLSSRAKKRPFRRAAATLERMVEGGRLKDIADMPLDLLV